MSTTERLLDPTGDSERDTNTTLAQPRPQSLRGLTVGLLDNTKPNGITILEAVGRADSACTSTVIRSVLHLEARHTIVPEQLATDLADSICRTGAMVRAFASVYVVLNPEHARLLDSRGWSKQDLKQAIIERGSRTYRELAASGKEAIAKGTGWRLPAGHPDALPQTAPSDPDTPVPVIRSAHDVQVVVAGAPNAGVSSIVETFGAVGRPPSVAKIEEQRQGREYRTDPGST